MQSYFDLVKRRKNEISVKCIVIIDNTTLRRAYSIATNLHVDFGIQPNIMNHYFGDSKREFNRQINKYKLATKRKFKHTSNDNDYFYTRLIYTLE